MSKKYSLNSSVILRFEPQYHNSFTVFDHRGVRTEFLTEEEYSALECIYSKPANVSEISKETGMKYKKCKKFLEHMVQLRYVEVNSDSQKIKQPKRVKVDPTLYKRFPIPFLSAPASVDIFITSRCNLNCVHCFSSIEEETIHELSAKELESIFSQFEELGILQVRINGGEPLLHPEIHEILRSIKERKFRKVILTNGTALDDEIINLLKESDVMPTVSLDDSEAKEHDRFRRANGSFNRTIEALKLLQKNRIQYGINCCLHKGNLNRYDEIINQAIKYGAFRVAFLDLKIMGRMKNHKMWVPSYKEYERTMFDLITARIVHRGKIDISLDAFLHCYPLKETISDARRGYVSCQAGKTSLSIDSRGSIYPCNLVLSDPKWKMGNSKDEKIREIWFSQKWLFFRGGVKVKNLNKCGDCKNLAGCKDFYCRLLPYITDGDPYGSHPNCS